MTDQRNTGTLTLKPRSDRSPARTAKLKGKREYTPAAKGPRREYSPEERAAFREKKKAERRAEIDSIRQTMVSHASKATQRKNQARLRFLQSLWPALYRNERRLPLKNDIKNDMLDDLDARGIRVPLNKLNLALHAYCRCQSYYMMVANTNNVFRYDINGKPVEKITREERKFSWDKVCDYRREHNLPQFRPFWFVPGKKKKGAGKGRPVRNFRKKSA